MDLKELKIRIPLEKLADMLGIKVKDSGKNAVALCPFHKDTTPSFTIDKARQIARCFSSSCADLGVIDHIKLIKLYEHLDEDDAVTRFYALAGEERPADSSQEILHKMLSLIHQNITMDAPLKFFQNRGITLEALQKLKVGYSPSAQWFKDQIKDVPPDESARLEFFRSEMFDNAIIYPVYDSLGRMAGFRSRPFKGTAKYIANSGDFKFKATRVYGMHLIKHNRQIVLVEGPNDVLGLLSAGVSNVGGLMGSHMEGVDKYLWNRGFNDVVFIADGDEAGAMAMIKAPPLIRVTKIPIAGVDPDDYAHQQGLLPVVNLINSAKFPIEIKLESKLSKIPAGLTGKGMLLKSIAQDISDGLPSILVGLVQDYVATALGISREDVAKVFDQVDLDTTRLENRMIAHMASNGETSPEIRTKVIPQMFFDSKARAQYKQILDGLTVTDVTSTITAFTEADLAQFVDLATRRQLRVALKKSSNDIANISIPLETTLEKTTIQMSNLTIDDVTVLSSGEALRAELADIEERAKNPGQLLGLSFGPRFPKMDQILFGLRPNNMYIVAATTGMGKSNLALEWAIHMSHNDNVPVLWVSLEMSAREMAARRLAKITGVSMTSILRAELTVEQTKLLKDQAINHALTPFYEAYCGGITIHQIVSLIRKYKITKDIKAVYIDYIQLVQGGPEDRGSYERIGYISGMLKNQVTMSKSIGIPVVAISQLTRQAAKVEVPTAENVAESYKISQDADAFLAIKQRTEFEIEEDKLQGRNYGNMLLNIDKNREGPSKQIVGLIFNKDNLSIKEVV